MTDITVGAHAGLDGTIAGCIVISTILSFSEIKFFGSIITGKDGNIVSSEFVFLQAFFARVLEFQEVLFCSVILSLSACMPILNSSTGLVTLITF